MENIETLETTASDMGTKLGYLALGTLAGSLVVLGWNSFRNYRIEKAEEAALDADSE